MQANLVYAPHWYDVMTLFRREYLPWLALDTLKGSVAITPPQVRNAFAERTASVAYAGCRPAARRPSTAGRIRRAL